MTWTETSDVEQYLAAVGDLLRLDVAVHTIALTVAENVRARPDGTRFAWWTEDGDITGAVSQTPPYPWLLSFVPEKAIEPFVQQFAPTAVSGPTALATQVASVAARAVALRPTIVTASRLFRLAKLVPPKACGAPRTASHDDSELLESWLRAFASEASVVSVNPTARVRDLLTYSGLVLWENAGMVVAMAGRARTAFGCARIGPVYTPPEHRRHGYGAAVTAAAVQRALDGGACEVVLFTDLTNPTSNALYPRLGFVAVSDRVMVEISPG